MKLIGGLDELVHRRALKRWEKIGAEAADLDLFSIQALRDQALDLRSRLDRVVHEADRRLAAPVTGGSDPSGPDGSDWVWRPTPFRSRLDTVGLVGVPSGHELTEGATLFHDCSASEITLKQRPGLGRAGAAPQGLELDVLSFDGSFLSLVLDLPCEAAIGLTRSHIIQVNLTTETERPLEVYARLNVRHGPNTEKQVREFDLRHTPAVAEFDLAYSSINDQQIERAWVDLIFEQPAMNHVALRDLVISRHLRAEV